MRNGRVVGLDPATAVQLEKGKRLPAHPNGMTFFVASGGAEVLTESYYSIGGGFVLTAAEMEAGPAKPQDEDVPYPFGTAAEMLAMGEASGLSIAAMKRANEMARDAGRSRRPDHGDLGRDGSLHRSRARQRTASCRAGSM